MPINYDTSKIDYLSNWCTVSVAEVEGGSTTGGNISIKKGEEITLRATANEGYEFVGWEVSDGTGSSENPYTITVNGNLQIYPRFAESSVGGKWLLTSTSGVIVSPESEDGYYDDGTEITVSMNKSYWASSVGYIYVYITDTTRNIVKKETISGGSISFTIKGNTKLSTQSPSGRSLTINCTVKIGDNSYEIEKESYRTALQNLGLDVFITNAEGVAGVPYTITLYNPKGYTIKDAYINYEGYSNTDVHYSTDSNIWTIERPSSWNGTWRIFYIVLEAPSEDSTYTVNVSQSGSGEVTLPHENPYNDGEYVSVKCEASPGAKFDHMVIGDKTIYSPNYTFIIHADTVIEVVFSDSEIQQVKITATTEPYVAGKVKQDKSIYQMGGTAVLTAELKTGYSFTKWQERVGTEWNDIGTTNPLSLELTKYEYTIRAVCEKAKDPYSPGGNSGTGGGDGTFDDSSDNPNDEINPPTMVDALLTIYSPTEAQITELGQYLYSDSAKGLAKNLLDYFGSLGTADLTAYIINTYQLPITVPTSGTKQVECGWYPTTVSMNVASGTAIEVGMGTCEVPAYYGNALDYKSRIQIYLPYVGFQDLDPAEVIGKTLGLKYFVDLITGDCVAKIYINDVIYYQFKGAMASPIPLGKDNFTDMIQQGINIGTGAITAGMAVSGAAGAISQGTAMHNFAIEQANAGTIYPEQFTASQQLIEEGTSRVPQAQMSLEQLQNKLSTAINTGTNVPHGTNAGGNMGWYMNQTPYIIIVRPNLSMPENYGHYHGYPSNITSKIGDLSGYTEFSAIHLEGLTATSNELAELEKILKGGIRIEN